MNILSFNIHKGKGWVRKSTIHLIQQQILEFQANIIFLQEIRGSQFEMLTEEIWPHFSYGKNAIYQKGHHGNAILSRYPITFSENIDLSMHRFERRGLLHSIVKLTEGYKILHLLCVHLGLFAGDRRKQLDNIVSYIKTNIPEDEPLILGGDFNDWHGYATNPLIKNLGLHEAFLNTHGAYAKTYPAWAPVLKLDRLYFRGFKINHAQRLIKKPWAYLSDHIALGASLKLIKRGSHD